jgi:hypothetical protein
VIADVGQEINLLQELILTTMRHSTLNNFQIEAIRPQGARFAGHVHRAKNMLCTLASRGIRTVSEGQNLCRKKYFWDEGTIPYGFGEKSGAGKKSAGDFWRDGAVWHQFGNSKKQPNNAIHRMATRVTLHAWARSSPGMDRATGSHR